MNFRRIIFYITDILPPEVWRGGSLCLRGRGVGSDAQALASFLTAGAVEDKK